MRSAHLVLRALTYREQQRGNLTDDWELSLDICQNSPAAIRGYLRELRDGGHRKRGRPKIKPRLNRRPISDYLIGKCFTPIQLRRARTPV